MIMCKPEKNKKQTICIIAVLILVAVLMYCMTTIIPAFKWFFQLAFLVSLVICLNYFINHSMTQWIYQLSESDFTVIKQTGAKQITVCSLALSESVLLISEAKYKETNEKAKHPNIRSRFNYCQNVNTGSYIYICKFRDDETLIKFEPNEIFVSAMNDAISNAKGN